MPEPKPSNDPIEDFTPAVDVTELEPAEYKIYDSSDMVDYIENGGSTEPSISYDALLGDSERADSMLKAIPKEERGSIVKSARQEAAKMYKEGDDEQTELDRRSAIEEREAKALYDTLSTDDKLVAVQDELKADLNEALVALQMKYPTPDDMPAELKARLIKLRDKINKKPELTQ